MTIQQDKQWFVYIVQCNDDTLYTGITTDIKRRLQEHNHDQDGARYTRARRPVKLRYCETQNNRSSAARREAQIKQLERKEKLRIISATALYPP